MANIYTSLPPHRLHSSHSISPNDALSLLSTYIAAANIDASLQPNAILTESGPTSSASGAGAGLAIHNLKRVEAGLKGEQLGEDLTFEKYGGEGMPGLLMGEGDDEGHREAKKEKKRRRSEAAEVDMQAEGWVDKETYDREREEEDNVQEGDLGDRVQGSTVGKEAERKRDRMLDSAGTATKGDKEARKKAKKERSKAEKLDREKKRQSEKDD